MKFVNHGFFLLAFMALAVSALEPPQGSHLHKRTPRIEACGECPPGACPDITGKPLLTFEDPKPVDGQPNTWHALQTGNGDQGTKLDVTITKGTHENPNDDARLILDAVFRGPDMGCWIIGITDDADPKKVEHYAALNGQVTDPKACEKVFQMPQKTTNKFRAWKVDDHKCPGPLLWHP